MICINQTLGRTEDMATQNPLSFHTITAYAIHVYLWMFTVHGINIQIGHSACIKSTEWSNRVNLATRSVVPSGNKLHLHVVSFDEVVQNHNFRDYLVMAVYSTYILQD